MKWAAGALTLLAALAPLHAPASPVSQVTGASTYAASSLQAPAVRNLLPAPGETLKAFFPRFSATIDTHGRAPLQRQSVRLYLDGTDVTAFASLSGDTVAYVPRERLRAGWHDVFLEGADTANQTFSDGWVFQTQDPDIDLPVQDGGFAFFPVGATPHRNGGFMHFFLVSPFDGVGLLQLCGFEVPFTHAAGSPVFFITVPATFGTLLLGCNPGVVFTPFGIGEFAPIFFPIEIAGPGFFQDRDGHRHRHPLNAITAPAYGASAMPGYRTTTPVYRSTTMPGYRTTGMPVYGTSTMPVYGTSTMPVYRTPAMPVYRTPAMPVYRTMPVKPAAAGPAVKPAIPHPYVPH